MGIFRRKAKPEAPPPEAQPSDAQSLEEALAVGPEDAPQTQGQERIEVMMPSALSAQGPLIHGTQAEGAGSHAPAGAAPPEGLDRKGRKAKAARPSRGPPALGAPLAVLALLLGAAAIALEVQGYAYGALALPAAAFLLALSAAFPMRPKATMPEESAKLRLTGAALVALAMGLTVAFVQGLAVFAATGLLFSLSQLAAVFVLVYPLLLGAFVVVGALLRLLAGRWGRVLDVSKGRRRGAALLAFLALAPGAIVLLAIAPFGEGLVSLSIERAPFVGALAVLAALGALGLAALPGFATMGEWLAREGLRRSRLAKDLTATFALLGILAAAGGVAAWVLVGPEAGILALGAGLLLAMLAGFPAGVARFVPPMSVQDPEAAMARVKAGLWSLLAGASLGLVALPAGIALVALEYVEPLVGGAILAMAALVQAGLALASPRFPVPAVLPRGRRSLAFVFSIIALLLTFFGLLVGSGLAQGPGVGLGLGVVLLLAASLCAAVQSLLRVVLVPSQRAADAPGEKKQKEAFAAADLDPKERITRAMHLTYAAGLVFTMLMVGSIAALSLGVVDVEGTYGLPDVMLVVGAAMLGLPFIAYATYRYVQVKNVEVEVQRLSSTSYTKRLSSEEVTRLVVLGLSISTAVVLLVLGVMTQFGFLRTLGPLDLAPKFSTDFFVFAILVGLGPFGFMHAREQARMRAIDQKFPEFLRDLAESKRAGMTLTQAVITASKGSYGPLTPDIRKMATQIEWGISFSEALRRFSRRARTPLIERSVSLIVQAQEAGGNVVDILHAAAEDAREIQLLLRERKTAMSIYVMIIYISFFVFLSVIGILEAQFLPQVAKAIGGVSGVSVGPIRFGTIDVEAFSQVFFHAAIVQAMGGGFVAGVMEEGRPSAGLRHVFIMVIVGYVAFRFVIG